MKKIFTLFSGAAALSDATSRHETALLVIDVQKRFCAPGPGRAAGTDAVVNRIASLVPEFRKAGVAVYAVYFESKVETPDQTGFYKFRMAPGDQLVTKNRNSAFRGSNIGELLSAAGHKNLIVCGFNLSYCVGETVLDARKKGFAVEVLRDMTANANTLSANPAYMNREMKRAGAVITSSTEVLGRLRQAPPPGPALN